MAGLAGSLLLGRSLAHHLQGIASTDPLSASVALGVILFVSFAACAIPAWRAARSDPAMTLRAE
jgi:ABC-type antimicrobial peptide transport system permease subunit